MSTLIPQDDSEAVYGASVADHDEKLARARKAVQDERAKHAEWQQALDARDGLVGEVFEQVGDDLSQNELARRIDLNPSTFRSIIKPLRARRR